MSWRCHDLHDDLQLGQCQLSQTQGTSCGKQVQITLNNQSLVDTEAASLIPSPVGSALLRRLHYILKRYKLRDRAKWILVAFNGTYFGSGHMDAVHNKLACPRSFTCRTWTTQTSELYAPGGAEHDPLMKDDCGLFYSSADTMDDTATHVSPLF
ncbi:hypothetical protein K458DRAFT_384998 [Lentithecium fluviatile CBS 122367]|uniref:Uncharacterized protein n=1 Tax=Lentithecium fluviatile CBS 122367 TaxID=1168545 RepID=A0A6G1JE62_9PLEO|nr:hypothetical protein K458DRAFT_384998 [Lentithecium fluviatile CBS 122367]